MLVLSRQRDESIVIGDNIIITIIDIRGDKVRLGINAPKEISVHRHEVFNRIHKIGLANGTIRPEDYRQVINNVIIIPKGTPLIPGTIIEVTLQQPPISEAGGS